jgi:hypothetical protein
MSKEKNAQYKQYQGESYLPAFFAGLVAGGSGILVGA